MSFLRPGQRANDVTKGSPPMWDTDMIAPMVDMFFDAYRSISMATATLNTQNWGFDTSFFKHATGTVYAFVRVVSTEYSTANAASVTVAGVIPIGFIPPTNQINRILTLWSGHTMRLDFMANASVIVYRPNGSWTAPPPGNAESSAAAFSWQVAV